jgi:hypothetical protein
LVGNVSNKSMNEMRVIKRKRDFSKVIEQPAQTSALTTINSDTENKERLPSRSRTIEHNEQRRETP